MSLDNQRNLQLAIAKDPRFLRVAEEVAAEMNQWAQGFFGRPIIADWRQQLDFTTKIFRARGLHLDDRHVRERGRHRLLRFDRRSRALRGQQPPAPARRGGIDRPLPAEDPDRRGGSAVERPARGARAAPRAADRHDQGLRPRRADRGVLPADGDPRRPRPPLRRLQHRAVGLHQQRRRRDGVGPGLHQPQYRRHRHDLRLHAQLRGPRAPGREHPGPERPLRALAGRYGAQHPGRLRSGRRRRHAQGEGRRRARATRGSERQVGGALEDGAHRAAGMGGGRRRQPARTRVSRRSPTRRRTPTGWCCSSRRRAPSGAPATC